MNERIKELVKEAGGEFWQRIENDVVNPEAYITFDPPQSLEKFAELIIKKCMDAVGDDPMAQPYLQRIKHAFGVEYYESIEKAFEK